MVTQESGKLETGSSEGVCLALLEDVDVGEGRGGEIEHGEAVVVKHSALFVLISKTLWPSSFPGSWPSRREAVRLV